MKQLLVFLSLLVFGDASSALRVKSTSQYGLDSTKAAKLFELIQHAKPAEAHGQMNQLAKQIANLAAAEKTGNETSDALDMLKRLIDDLIRDLLEGQFSEVNSSINDFTEFQHCASVLSEDKQTCGGPPPPPPTTTTGASTTSTTPQSTTQPPETTTPTPPVTTTTTTLQPQDCSTYTDAVQVCHCEAQEIEARLTACNTLHDARKGLSDATCAAFAEVDKTTGEAQQEKCAQAPWNNWDEDDYEGYLESHVQLLADWREKNSSCATALDSTQQQKNQCDAIQDEYNAKLQACLAMSPDPVPPPGYVPSEPVTTGGTVAQSPNPPQSPVPPTGPTVPTVPLTPENVDCAQYHCLNQACSDYAACYDAAVNAKETDRASATESTNTMTVTYVTLMRMNCLLNIIGMAGDQSAEIDACNERYRVGSPLVDPSLLTPMMQPYPAREPCERLDIPSGCVQVAGPPRPLGNTAGMNLFR